MTAAAWRARLRDATEAGRLLAGVDRAHWARVKRLLGRINGAVRFLPRRVALRLLEGHPDAWARLVDRASDADLLALGAELGDVPR